MTQDRPREAIVAADYWLRRLRGLLETGGNFGAEASSFVSAARPRVVGAVLARGASYEDAEDAAQVSFLDALLPGIRNCETDERLVSYLCKTATRAYFRALRREPTAAALIERLGGEAVAAAVNDTAPADARGDWLDALEEALAALPAESHAFVRELIVEERSHAEVAALYGITVVASRKRLQRIVQTLRAAVVARVQHRR